MFLSSLVIFMVILGTTRLFDWPPLAEIMLVALATFALTQVVGRNRSLVPALASLWLFGLAMAEGWPFAWTALVVLSLTVTGAICMIQQNQAIDDQLAATRHKSATD